MKLTFEEKSIELLTGEMKLVPGGEFPMGSDKPDASDNVKPCHNVYVGDFYMDTFSVTNELFLEFSNDTGYLTVAEKKGEGDTHIDGKWQWVKGANWRHPFGPGSFIENAMDHPVILVTPVDAFAFCRWRSRKEKIYFRLPTEAEWEKAARGLDGRLYPWGDDPPEDGSTNKANFKEEVARGLMPVDAFPEGTSPYGIQCMAGNAWEWCLDAYDENYYHKAPKKDKGGPITKAKGSVFRGGSFIFPKDVLLATERHRNNLIRPSVGIGFRTVAPSKKWDSKRLRIYNRKIIHVYQAFKVGIKQKLRPGMKHV